MGFDTLYRPRRFDEVVGQKHAIALLKRLLERNEACQSSYVFAGLSGSGKTTLARIYARAIVCGDRDPHTMEPCNVCDPCRSILDQASSDCFVELDAANHSGAEAMRQIIESLSYMTLGGSSRKIYLFDEAHRLSTQAQDALLKPMEDVIPQTKDRRMVAFFCTTELEKIRTAIRSRSHTIKIQTPSVEEIVARLALICTQEGVSYDRDALTLIVEQGRGHIRDMIKTLERVVQMSGDVSREASQEILGVDVHPVLFDALTMTMQGGLKQAFMLLQEKVLSKKSGMQVLDGLKWALLETYKATALTLPSAYEGHAAALLNALEDKNKNILRVAHVLDQEMDRLSLQDEINDLTLLYVLGRLSESLTVPEEVAVQHVHPQSGSLPPSKSSVQKVDRPDLSSKYTPKSNLDVLDDNSVRYANRRMMVKDAKDLHDGLQPSLKKVQIPSFKVVGWSSSKSSEGP
jgi:DNA polymerase III subunit gamma/tau